MVKKDAKKDVKKGGKKEDKKSNEPPINPELEAKLNESTGKIEKYEADMELLKQKVKLVKENLKRFAKPENYPKVIDLVDENGERKYIKTKKDIYANTYLADKAGFDVVEITISEDGKDTEEVKPIEIEGMCVRNLEEERVAMEEEANKPPEKGKGGKGAKGKKK